MMETDWLTQETHALEIADQLVGRARAARADRAEAVFSYGRQSSLSYRQGEVSDLEQSEDLGLSLRVWVGGRVAYLSGNQLDRHGLADLADQAVARARLLPISPLVDLPETPDVPGWQIQADTAEPSLSTLIEEAKTLYDGAMATAGITNSDGGSAAYSKSRTALVASNGLAVSGTWSHFYRGISVQAGQGDDQVRAHDSHTKTHREDMRALSAIIQRATEKALKRVGARPDKGFVGPVIFDAPMAKSLIGGFLGAINGSAVAKGQSFLKDAMGSALFSDTIQIMDDPTLPRGLGSKPIDREGHVPSRLNLIEQGILKNWLLDRRSAHMLNLKTNGRASHSGGGLMVPSATNVLVSGGAGSQDDLIRDIKQGLLITGMMGNGLNPLTGDYSRGAEGFLIENGRITAPVQAMTVAGNMRDMFKTMVLGNDMDRDGALHVPSILVPHMSISGI